jgi:hypothetical protein
VTLANSSMSLLASLPHIVVTNLNDMKSVHRRQLAFDLLNRSRIQKARTNHPRTRGFSMESSVS